MLLVSRARNKPKLLFVVVFWTMMMMMMMMMMDFSNHSSLFCKALTFSLLERRTDNGLTSYSLSLFLSRTNEQKQPNDVHSLFNAINILNILI
jgi:hypothetical protein